VRERKGKVLSNQTDDDGELLLERELSGIVCWIQDVACIVAKESVSYRNEGHNRLGTWV
jgi:hypothetical protein